MATTQPARPIIFHPPPLTPNTSRAVEQLPGVVFPFDGRQLLGV